VSPSLLITPPWPRPGELARRRPAGSLAGTSLADWRTRTRRELGLADDRPVVATGHQTLLWHPGILAKYLLVEAVAARTGFAVANLVVDQHAAAADGTGGFGDLAVPDRRPDGTLAARTLRLATARPEVPMGLHPAFDPVAPALPDSVFPDSVRRGVAAIHAAVAAHRDAPDASLQMAAALTDLMARWVRPIPHVTATRLLDTSLGRALVAAMAADPRGCAEAYNAAVRAVPHAHVRPLLVRDDYVELPLWRIRPDGRRMHAYDHDVERVSGGDPDAPRLLPRALFMTALVRLGLCDLFVHGTGGARYDVAMERWMDGWLGAEVAPVAVATATLTLDLLPAGTRLDVPASIAAGRRAWHDPERSDGDAGPGPRKRRLLAAVAASPRRSRERRRAFHEMHEAIAALRAERAPRVRAAADRARAARRQAAAAPVLECRTWAFPLHDPARIDDLAAEVGRRVRASGSGRPAVPAPCRRA
jgi:hypothetical protein